MKWAGLKWPEKEEAFRGLKWLGNAGGIHAFTTQALDLSTQVMGHGLKWRDNAGGRARGDRDRGVHRTLRRHSRGPGPAPTPETRNPPPETRPRLLLLIGS